MRADDETAAESRRTKQTWLAAILAGTTALAAPASPVLAQATSTTTPGAAVAQSGTAQRFDIAAQPLDAALAAFAAASGIQLLYNSAATSGLRSPGVSGTLTPEEALRTLLAGTGLGPRFTGPRAATIEKLPGAAPGVTMLEPVTVLATRQANVPLSNVPASVSIVTREQIAKEQSTAPRVEDILTRTVPGFNPTNNGVRQIRGRNAQVFMNGAPMNEQLRGSSGSDLNLLPPDHLAEIEVSRGANSAYGFGSPGGIIALSTPRAQSEELTLNTKVRGSFDPQKPGGSYQTTLYQSASQIVGNFDYHVAGSLTYDGLEFDSDGKRSLGFNSPNGLSNAKEGIGAFDGSFGYDLGHAGKLRLTGIYSYTDVFDGYALGSGGVYRQIQNTVDRFSPADDNYREGYSFNASYENEDVWGSSLKIEVLSSSVYTQAFRAGTGNRTVRDEQSNQYQGIRSSMTTPLPGVYDGLAVTYGVDLLRNRFYRPVYFADTGALESYVSPDVTLDSVAPYAQIEFPVGPFRLSGGVRHEEYSGSVETAVGSGGIQGGDIKRFDLTLFNAGIVYPINGAVDIFGSFTQGAEITQLGRAARNGGRADLIDPQPAKSNQYEIGVRRLKGPLRYSFFDLLHGIGSTELDRVRRHQPVHTAARAARILGR
jgi:iron complex outermembrane receptor protein